MVDKEKQPVVKTIYLLIDDEGKVLELYLFSEEEFQQYTPPTDNSIIEYQKNINIDELQIEEVKESIGVGTKNLYWEGYLFEKEPSNDKEESLIKEIDGLKNKIVELNKKNEKSQMEMLELIMSLA